MIEIPPKLKNNQNTPWNLKNDQNTPETLKLPKYSRNLKNN